MSEIILRVVQEFIMLKKFVSLSEIVYSNISEKVLKCEIGNIIFITLFEYWFNLVELLACLRGDGK